MLSLSASERSCWITLLAYASVNDNGKITFLSEEQLMMQAGLDFQYEEWDRTKGVLKKFEKLGMIHNDNGMITVTNWQKRQETNLTSYERVKRHREKKRNDNAMITPEENRIEENKDFANAKSLPLKIEKDEPEKKRQPQNRKALELREWCYDRIEEEYGSRSTTNMGDYVQIVKALKHLSEKDIKTMVEDALSAGKGKTVRSIFTDREIDLYRQENL